MELIADCQYCEFGKVYGGDLICSKTQETMVSTPSDCIMFEICGWMIEEIKEYREELRDSIK